MKGYDRGEDGYEIYFELQMEETQRASLSDGTVRQIIELGVVLGSPILREVKLELPRIRTELEPVSISLDLGEMRQLANICTIMTQPWFKGSQFVGVEYKGGSKSPSLLTE